MKAFYRLITGKQRLPIRQNVHFPFTVTGKQQDAIGMAEHTKKCNRDATGMRQVCKMEAVGPQLEARGMQEEGIMVCNRNARGMQYEGTEMQQECKSFQDGPLEP